MSVTHPVRADECLALAVGLTGEVHKLLRRAEEFGLKSADEAKSVAKLLNNQITRLRMVGDDVTKATIPTPKASPKRKAKPASPAPPPPSPKATSKRPGRPPEAKALTAAKTADKVPKPPI